MSLRLSESLARSLAVASSGASDSDLALNKARYDKHRPLFVQVGAEKGVPPHLLAAIAWTESALDETAVNSSTNASGLMQIIPTNFTRYGISQKPLDPLGNIRAGASDLLAKGYGKKPLRDVVKGYNGFRSESDTVKLAAFQRYYQRITARWIYLAGIDTLP